MKKITIIILIAVFFSVSLLAFASCKDATPDAITDKYADLAEGGRFTVAAGGESQSAVFDFGKNVQINALVIREKTDSVTSFKLYADDSLTEFYGNDFIGGFRYCYFDTQSLSKLRIEVVSCEGNWKLDDLEAYLTGGDSSAADFRIMSYITVDSILYMDGEEYADSLSSVTQFNVFGSLDFDKYGNIVFRNYNKDGVEIDGREVFEYALGFVRKYNPSAQIIATVLGNTELSGGGVDTEQCYTSAMDGNRKKFIDNLLSVIDEYSLDGISFDYEYPYKLKSYRVYKSFLKELDKALPQGKLLTASLSLWQLGIGKFAKSDLEVLDQIEVMSYDYFDERGNHSAFYNACYETLETFRSKNFDMTKINLGLPFYSRPVDASAFWGDYKKVAEELYPWGNTYVQSYTDVTGKEYPPTANYYNGVQIIKDKTAYAIDVGAGGVMIWHFACDSPDPRFSLVNAIAEVKSSKCI